MIAIPFSPTAYGHAGIMPAWLMLVGGDADQRMWYGALPMLLTWLILLGVFLARGKSATER